MGNRNTGAPTTRGLQRAALLSVALVLTGCGAAYYGAAIGVFASQKDKKVTDVSFPDAAPTADTVPAFATLVLSDTAVTLDRDLSTFNPSADAGTGVTELTDFEVLSVDFPAGYGEAISNRDAGTVLNSGDRLVVRLNGDQARELVFDGTDIASVGTEVAARLQLRIRALTPVDAAVPAAAYALFTAVFDEPTRSYRFRSGAPGEASEVVFEPEPRDGENDAVPDATSAETAEGLGLGVDAGGIEVSGAESVGFVLINRGTDVVPAGTNVDLYLSHDKVLDKRIDLPFDRVELDATVAVGEARRFTRVNGGVPVTRLLRQDVTEGAYYVLFDVSPSGGEKTLDNNLLVSSRTVEVYQPLDDPSTDLVETATDLDISVVNISTPIGAVTGSNLDAAVTLTNLGAPVGPLGVLVDLELVLSHDVEFDEPASFRDPLGNVAGLFISPTDPASPIQVVILASGTSGIGAVVAGSTITVTYDDGTGVTVQDLIDALNVVTGQPVDVVTDGNGDPSTDLLDALIVAADATQVIARDVHIASRQVTFTQEDRLQQTQSFLVSGTISTTALKTTQLPRKLTPIVRARPVLPGPLTQNANNDARRASNFVRVYDRARATFDSTTGATLPTVNADDFAALDAVTQRPVNTGSIRQGQQRVFRFELPDTGVAFDESQLLIILRTTNFDAHMDLLSSSGAFLVGSDDTGLGTDPAIYVAAQANPQSRSFYIMVSSARSDESDLAGGGETFELTISVNPRQPGDSGLVSAVSGANLTTQVPQRYEAESPRTVNDLLIPFSLANGKAEVSFVLPQRARVRFGSRPVFTIGVDTTITEFVASQVPSPVEHQLALDDSQQGIVYRPAGGTIATSHILEAGVYTVALETSQGVPETLPFRLEIATEFIPADE